MILTEADAKTKLCHKTLAPVFNGRSAITAPKVCIGSDCMAWRWSYGPDEAKGNKNGPVGYCGKAGKP